MIFNLKTRLVLEKEFSIEADTLKEAMDLVQEQIYKSTDSACLRHTSPGRHQQMGMQALCARRDFGCISGNRPMEGFLLHTGRGRQRNRTRHTRDKEVCNPHHQLYWRQADIRLRYRGCGFPLNNLRYGHQFIPDP